MSQVVALMEEVAKLRLIGSADRRGVEPWAGSYGLAGRYARRLRGVINNSCRKGIE
jgi:hypothetical protein